MNAHAASQAQLLSKKKPNEKLFFVTDHKLYEENNVRMAAGGTVNDHKCDVSGEVANPSNNSLQKLPNWVTYDIEMENVYVKPVADGGA